MEIIRGTTPTIIYTFKEIKPSDISECYLLIKQNGNTVIERTLSDGEVSDTELRFTLSQADTLSLAMDKAQIILDWKTQQGIRGRSAIVSFSVKQEGKNNEY